MKLEEARQKIQVNKKGTIIHESMLNEIPIDKATIEKWAKDHNIAYLLPRNSKSIVPPISMYNRLCLLKGVNDTTPFVIPGLCTIEKVEIPMRRIKKARITKYDTAPSDAFNWTPVYTLRGFIHETSRIRGALTEMFKFLRSPSTKNIINGMYVAHPKGEYYPEYYDTKEIDRWKQLA